MKYGIPGPGGNMGLCPVCSESFLKEILLGETVPTMKIDGFDALFAVHKKCGRKIVAVSKNGGNWKDLPEGPLRQEFQKNVESEANDDNTKA